MKIRQRRKSRFSLKVLFILLAFLCIILIFLSSHSQTQAELSGTQPELSGTQPELSGTQAELSGTQPELSGTQPELSGTQPESSGTQPESSEIKSLWKITNVSIFTLIFVVGIFMLYRIFLTQTHQTVQEKSIIQTLQQAKTNNDIMNIEETKNAQQTVQKKSIIQTLQQAKTNNDIMNIEETKNAQQTFEQDNFSTHPDPSDLNIPIYGIPFSGGGRFGDYQWMIDQEKYKHSLFIFNDNIEDHKTPDIGGGNAVIRNRNRYGKDQAFPRAAGITTGSRWNGGFNVLNENAKNIIDADVAEIHDLLSQHKYNAIYYIADDQGLIGQSIFRINDDVRKYIVERIQTLSKQPIQLLNKDGGIRTSNSLMLEK